MNVKKSFILRDARSGEHQLLTELCMRSKAVWGYDKQFLEHCRLELTLTEKDCLSPHIQIAERTGVVLGIAEISIDDKGCFLDKLFVDPAQQAAGVGKALFDWAKKHAASLRQTELIIEADPGAVGFYQKMGASLVGKAASQSIPGRSLPKLILPLN